MPQFETTFSREKAFEDAVIERLIAYGSINQEIRRVKEVKILLINYSSLVPSF